MVSDKIKQKAAESITDKPVEFTVDYNGQKLPFAIKKLVLETLIKISGERAKLVKFDSETTNMGVINSMGTNAPILARCVAIAVINSQPIPVKKKSKIKFFTAENKTPIDFTEPEYLNESELTDLFIKTLDSVELAKLSKAVVMQMDSDFFFAAMVSMGGIDLLEKSKTKDTDPLIPSGEE